MIDPRTQHEVPSGDDVPERAWHNRLSDSIHDILTFGTLAEANTWAADPDHSAFAINGRQAWITAENAVYVRSGGSWRKQPQSASPAAAVFFTPAAGFTINSVSVEVTGRSVVWQMRLDHAGVALVAGGQTLALGTVQAPYRPRTYFAQVQGWVSPPANTIMSGLCAQSTGLLELRWASAAASAASQFVLTGAWPLA